MKRIASVLTITVVLLLLPAVAVTQDLPESSPKALMHHAQGIEAYVAARYQEAVGRFRLAYQSDPTSYLSLLMAGISAGNIGQGAVADSFYALVLPHKDKLSPYYRLRLEAQMAGRAGNADGYLDGNRQAAAIGPGTKASYNVAQAAGPRGMVREALASLRTLDPDKEPMQGWLSYFTVYAPAAHLLGDFEDELVMARRARAAFPGNLVAVQLEGDALPALGKTAETEALLTAARDMAPTGGTTPADLMTTAAQELAAHGDAAASRRWLENAVQWYDGLPAADANTLDSRAGKAYALYSLGRYRDAAPIYNALATEFPANGAWKAWGGYLAALNGDKATAADVSRRIEAGEIAFSPVNRAIWRGLIAAALNDREAAVARFQESGVRQRWMHRDPVLMKVFKDDPRLAEYLKPIG